MRPVFLFTLSFLVLAVSGCSRKAAQYPTSSTPPDLDSPPPPTFKPSVNALGVPTSGLEVEALVEGLFRGLSIGSVSAMRRVLAPDALVKRARTGSGTMALPTLQALYAKSLLNAQGYTWGELHIVRLKHLAHSSETIAKVRISDSEAFEGEWLVVVAGTPGKSLITEIIVPRRK